MLTAVPGAILTLAGTSTWSGGAINGSGTLINTGTLDVSAGNSTGITSTGCNTGMRASAGYSNGMSSATA